MINTNGIINPFIDERPIPKIAVKFKTKIKTNSKEDIRKWHTFMSRLMKEEKNKYKYSQVALIRNIVRRDTTADDIVNLIKEKDLAEKFELLGDVFKDLSVDVKSYVLGMAGVLASDLNAVVQAKIKD